MNTFGPFLCRTSGNPAVHVSLPSYDFVVKVIQKCFGPEITDVTCPRKRNQI